MNEQVENIPTPGFRLLGVSAAYQHYAIFDPEAEGAPKLGDDEQVKFSWDWRVSGPRRFEVYLGVFVLGTKDEPQEVDVRVVGSFAIDGPSPALGNETFVHTSAPAILLPYVREKITRLTADGPYGPIWLPIMNVQALMERYPFEDTQGAKQLEEDPGLLDDPGNGEG